jgi:hypothetical protein
MKTNKQINLKNHKFYTHAQWGATGFHNAGEAEKYFVAQNRRTKQWFAFYYKTKTMQELGTSANFNRYVKTKQWVEVKLTKVPTIVMVDKWEVV